MPDDYAAARRAMLAAYRAWAAGGGDRLALWDAFTTAALRYARLIAPLEDGPKRG